MQLKRQIERLYPLLPALVLAACHATPPPAPPIEVPSARSGQGIDMATDAGQVLNGLQNSGLDFIARYYREPQSRWPALSAGEAALLSSLGLKVVAVWESHSRTPAHFSYASGYGDATMASDEARAVGQPAGSAIYFAVDFNARNRSLDLVGEYFRGVAAGLAAADGATAGYAVGVYGSGAVCDELRAAGLAQYCWLSNSIAWEGSIGYEGWDIRQGGRVPGLGFSHDADEARGDYGAFALAGYAAASGQGRPGGLVAQRGPSDSAPPPPR